MRRMTREALEAGAFGFTTSRTNSHKTPTGEMVPGRYSEVQELLGIGSALKGLRHGAFGVNSDFEIETEELAWMTQLGQETGRPVWFLLTDRPTDPVRWQRLMEGVRTARAQGAFVTAQIAGRPVGVMLGVDTALNPFSIRPTYQELLKLPAARAPRAAAGSGGARGDPGRRAVGRTGAAAVAVPPADHHTVGSHVRHGRSAGLRAGGEQQHRRDGEALEPLAGRGGVRLPGRRPRQVPVLPDRRLQRGQSRHHPHHADLARDGAGAVGWRRALLLDQRRQRCRAGCWRTGGATGSAGRACRWS